MPHKGVSLGAALPIGLGASWGVVQGGLLDLFVLDDFESFQWVSELRGILARRKALLGLYRLRAISLFGEASLRPGAKAHSA